MYFDLEFCVYPNCGMDVPTLKLAVTSASNTGETGNMYDD